MRKKVGNVGYDCEWLIYRQRETGGEPGLVWGGDVLCAMLTAVDTGQQQRHAGRVRCALPVFQDGRMIAKMTAFPCILYQHLQVWLDGHVCAVYMTRGGQAKKCLANLSLFLLRRAAVRALVPC